MDKQHLALNLAVSLANGPWTADSLQAALKRRLPQQLHKQVVPLGKEVFARHPGAYAPGAALLARTLVTITAFQRIYGHCTRHDIWPDPDLSAPVMCPAPAFAELDLPPLNTVEVLADWLLLPKERLDYLADPSGRHEEHGDMAVNHYHYALLEKKSGRVRLIEAPKQMLKSVQRQILRGILDPIPAHAHAFGFVRGRRMLDAAGRHVGEAMVMSFDLRHFFTTVNQARVFGLFRCLGYPHTVARYLTALCTTVTPARMLERLAFTDRTLFRQTHLPQGAPSSPALANQAAFSLDRRLSALARRVGANYSRYADDLTFSGNRHICGVLLRAVPDIVQDEGFAINPRKTRLMSGTSRQRVTGIIVNRHLNVPRDTYDRLKAEIHACAKEDDHRFLDPVFRARLLGKIDWVEAVNPPRGQKLRHLLAKSQRQGS